MSSSKWLTISVSHFVFKWEALLHLMPFLIWISFIQAASWLFTIFILYFLFFHLFWYSLAYFNVFYVKRVRTCVLCILFVWISHCRWLFYSNFFFHSLLAKLDAVFCWVFFSLTGCLKQNTSTFLHTAAKEK